MIISLDMRYQERAQTRTVSLAYPTRITSPGHSVDEAHTESLPAHGPVLVGSTELVANLYLFVLGAIYFIACLIVHIYLMSKI